MKLNILGCYAATPRSFTNPTSQVLEMKNELFLIDCGEGTQVQLRRNKIKFSRIKHIFISHLHGDHSYGLVGLISTFRLLNRETELHVYGPKGIKEIIILQLKLSNSWTNYPLYFHELSSKEPQLIFENEKLSVETIPLIHRIYTNGFLFKEKPGDRKLLINKAVEYNIDVSLYKSLKKGKDVTSENGELIPNHLVTAPPEPTKSYAYCSDTAFNQKMIPQISGATVLYHESTFLEDKAELAFPTKHSTAKEAAQIAKEAGVKKLILGHYSTRYSNINLFREEAEGIFPEVDLADDGKVFVFE
ncbi:ribonuclease Z [Salegentibacter salinarum]|uniref:Ribonuclease Z n=1 Tax=Salegentibacter salinarum TaxID=447422 RepID=A0A2N0TWW3_9FLAO|nr:ribonuclease Z [Salegentibacter salinarum]PKD19237.1 ribonuclease Z [Salegentibacter salinarum]SKB94721.1 ribonuclease Z [Salegentibacter salinarum]